MKAVKDNSAPGATELLRLFINTADFEHPEREQLRGPEAAARWLQAHGLLPGSDSLDVAGFEELLALREAFRLELLAHTGEGDPQVSWEGLAIHADRAQLGVRCAEQPREIELVALGGGSQLVAGRLFAIMYDAIRTGDWPRLKACRKESCLFAFYDRSKNASGAWCDMAICGNRAKAQRRRRRETGWSTT